MQYEKCKNLLHVQQEVIVNATCGISSAILIGENGKVQYSSIVTFNGAMLKYYCNVNIVQR